MSPPKRPLTDEEKRLEMYEQEQKLKLEKQKREKPARGAAKVSKPTLRSKPPLFLRITVRDRLLFSKHLAVMIDAGIPLREALDAMREQASSNAMKFVLAEAIADLSDGQVLAFTLTKFPKLFDSFFSNIISVGESSGTLPNSLRYLAIQLEKSMDLESKVKTALVYPVIVFVGALGVGSYLAFFMLPQLLPLFTSLDIKLPFTTRLLLAITTAVVHYWFWVIGLAVVLGFLLIFLWYLKPVRFAIHRAIIRIPVFGSLTKNVQTTQFSRILGTLLTSGVKVVPALRITANSLTNLAYQFELKRIADLVERGESIGSQLKNRQHLFTKTTTSMIGVGERTGKLSESLIALADFTDREVDATTKNLSALIEPFVLILVGIIVGFVALSIITPIYQLTQGLSR